MKKLEDIIKVLSENKSMITQKYGVNKIGVFGSYVRSEQDKDSDIDIIVEFKEGYKTFDNYMDLKDFLEEIFSVKVDLIVESAIKPNLKPYILEEIQYA